MALIGRRFSTWKTGLFLLLAVAPAVLWLLYSVLLATPLYQSDVAFSIRSRSVEAPAGGIGQLTQQLGVGLESGNDLYAIRAFLNSEEALEYLEAEMGYLSAFRRDWSDPVLGFGSNPSSADILDRFHWLFDVRLSTFEQIVTVEARGFSPEMARMAAAKGVEAAEAFVNRLNARANEDFLRFTRAELAVARDRVTETRLSITDWRNRNSSIDPSLQIGTIQGNLNSLEQELALVRAEVSNRFTPKKATLRNRVRALEREIAAERERLAGSSSEMAPLIAEFERLQIERELADRQYEAATQAFQTAQQEVAQQQKYIVVVSRPSAADERAYPRPLYHTAIVFLVGLALYGIVIFGANVVSDYREQ